MTKQSRKKVKKRKVVKKPKKISPLAGNNKYWVLGLLALTFIALSPLINSDFLNYDDLYYIQDNPFITNLNFENLQYLFSNYYGNQYSPVAMGIVGMEIKLFGLNTVPLKVFSILFHLLNVFLVFRFIQLLLNKFEYAIITAAAFAIHPLQVESVGWLAASNKISVFAAFLLLSLIYYLIYLDKGKRKSLVWSILFFLLACFSKEQAIVLPAILLAIDYLKKRTDAISKLLIEKIPYFLLSLIFAYVTLSVSGEQSGDFLMDYYNLTQRLVFSCATLVQYVFMFLAPVGLSAVYPYPGVESINMLYYISPLFVVLILACLYFFHKRDQRLLNFAILFFLINLGLSLLGQLMAVRDAMMADRYMYLPIIGLGILVAWVATTLNSRYGKPMITWSVLGLIAVGFSALTFTRAGLWKNTETIFTDVIDNQREGYNIPVFVYVNRGVDRKSRNNLTGAMDDFNKAIEVSQGRFASGYLNRGNLLFADGKLNEALQDYAKVIELDPKSPKVYSSRGAVYATQQRNELALQDFNKAIELDPYFRDALRNRIKLYYFMGQFDKARPEIEFYKKWYPNMMDNELIAIQKEVFSR